MDWFTAEDYTLARLVFQRALAAVYLVAFLVALNQFRALLGDRGLLPDPDVSAAGVVPARAEHLPLALLGPVLRRGGLTGAVLAAAAVARCHRPACRCRPRCSSGWCCGRCTCRSSTSASVVLLRLGDAAARGRLPRDLPGQRQRRTAAARADRPALAAVPGRVRRRADQAARRPVLARPHLPVLPPRDPADARPVQLVLPPAAEAAAPGGGRRATTSPSSSCRSACSSRSRSPAPLPRS